MHSWVCAAACHALLMVWGAKDRSNSPKMKQIQTLQQHWKDSQLDPSLCPNLSFLSKKTAIWSAPKALDKPPFNLHILHNYNYTECCHHETEVWKLFNCCDRPQETAPLSTALPVTRERSLLSFLQKPDILVLPSTGIITACLDSLHTP